MPPRIVMLTFVFVVLGGILVGGRGLSTVAQDATPDPAEGTADHPLVGAWHLDTDADDPANPPSLAIFGDDGTYLQADPDGSTGIGAWTPTAAQTADLIIFFHAAEEEQLTTTVIIRAAVEVTADGASFTAPFTLELVGPDGTSTGELGPATAVGERIGVEPMGTPVATLEEVFGPPDATPAP